MRRVSSSLLLGLLLSVACRGSSSMLAKDVPERLFNYEVACASQDQCIDSVALLVGLRSSHEPMRCTAALIGPRTAVTARHCVEAAIGEGRGCAGVWLGFPRTRERPSEWLACEAIISASQAQAGLLAPDYAVLRLQTEARRSALPITNEAVPEGEVLRMVSVTADHFYDEVHQLQTRRCVVDDQRRLMPWADAVSAAVRVLSACPIHQGNSGSPLLDERGRMRGLVHAGGPPFLALGVMTESEQIAFRTGPSPAP
jgi:hypothetical protein